MSPAPEPAVEATHGGRAEWLPPLLNRGTQGRLLLVLCALLLWGTVQAEPRPLVVWHTAAVGAALALLFVCGWLSVRGRQVFWLLGITAAAVALEALSPASPAAVGIYVAIASAAYRLPVRPGAAFAAASALAWLIAS